MERELIHGGFPSFCWRLLFPTSTGSVNEARRASRRPWRRDDGRGNGQHRWPLQETLCWPIKKWKFPPSQTPDNHFERRASALTFLNLPGPGTPAEDSGPAGNWLSVAPSFHRSPTFSLSLLSLFFMFMTVSIAPFAADYLLDLLHVCKWTHGVCRVPTFPQEPGGGVLDDMRLENVLWVWMIQRNWNMTPARCEDLTLFDWKTNLFYSHFGNYIKICQPHNLTFQIQTITCRCF